MRFHEVGTGAVPGPELRSGHRATSYIEIYSYTSYGAKTKKQLRLTRMLRITGGLIWPRLGSCWVFLRNPITVPAGKRSLFLGQFDQDSWGKAISVPAGKSISDREAQEW